MSETHMDMPVIFTVGDDHLVGVLHLPQHSPSIGVVIVVGGPQYRLGSHRQFLLLARDLAASGVAALRFDCRGMGDSDGEFPGFENIGSDIKAAVDALLHAAQSVRQVVLWGLCDAASAICFYAPTDHRIAGIALLNPWVRTEAGQARAYLKHYYLRRLTDREFLRKLATGGFKPVAAVASLLGNLARAFGGGTEAGSAVAPTASDRLSERMALGCERYGGPTLLIISGKDLTAREFEDAARASKNWRRIFREPRFRRHDLADADHTFSRRQWRNQVSEWTQAWIRDCVDKDGARGSR